MAATVRANTDAGRNRLTSPPQSMLVIEGDANNSPTTMKKMEWQKLMENVQTPDKDRYKCANCKQFLVPPVKQTGCGHRMCSACVDNIRQSRTNMICPGGEEDCVSLESEANFFPDKGIVREMEKLKAPCGFKTLGCDAQIQLKEILAHEVNCSYRPVECKNKKFGCNEQIPFCKQSEHNANCDYRKCKYCQSFFKSTDLQQHEKSCESQEQPCNFVHLGCDKKDKPANLEVHKKDCTPEHLDMTLTSVLDLISKLTMMKDELEEQKRTMSTSTQKLQDLTAEEEKLKAKYRQVQKQVAAQNEYYIKSQDEIKKKVVELEQLLSSLQVSSSENQRKIQQLENNPRTGMSSSQSTQLVSVQNSLAAQELQFREFDLRFQCLETASYDGILIWKIRDYSRRKQEAVSGQILSLYSQPFYTSKFGYKMCARVYLNGDGMGKGTHLSLFFVVMKGDYDSLLAWPFKQKVTLTMLDQVNGVKHLSDTFRPDPTSTSFRRPQLDMNVASGCPLFVAQQVVESQPYLYDDTIYIKVTVDTNDIRQP